MTLGVDVGRLIEQMHSVQAASASCQSRQADLEKRVASLEAIAEPAQHARSFASSVIASVKGAVAGRVAMLVTGAALSNPGWSLLSHLLHLIHP